MLQISEDEYRRLKAAAGEPIERKEPCGPGQHVMRSIGGANASCDWGRDCQCSVAVFECVHCGVSDYGETERAAVIERCEYAALFEGDRDD